jgi:hypothetical protein
MGNNWPTKKLVQAKTKSRTPAVEIKFHYGAGN